MIKASVLEMLEDEVKRGRVERIEALYLKGGFGKCTIYKDRTRHLDTRVYEAGKTVLEVGATIGSHTHLYDSESWTVIAGKVEVNSVVYGPGATITCEKGKKHYCVNLADSESVLRFVKKI